VITTIEHGRVRELRLSRPPVNALNPALMVALRAALDEASRDGCGGLVVSGAPGRFSGGLDVPELLRFGRPEIRETWGLFFALMRDIATSAVPIAAAMTGHSPAGGTVLAIFADYRVMADGPYFLGLNEVQVGLPVPEVLFDTLVRVVGPRQAERLAVGGLLIGPAEALHIGLVDEVVPAGEVIPRAVGWLTDLLARPAGAMSKTRQVARRSLRDAFHTVTPALMDAIADHWFSPETQAVMQALSAKLGKRA
jgi:Delta3-Delta2-enoyl-CoA isomerase